MKDDDDDREGAGNEFAGTEPSPVHPGPRSDQPTAGAEERTPDDLDEAIRLYQAWLADPTDARWRAFGAALYDAFGAYISGAPGVYLPNRDERAEVAQRVWSKLLQGLKDVRLKFGRRTWGWLKTTMYFTVLDVVAERRGPTPEQAKKLAEVEQPATPEESVLEAMDRKVVRKIVQDYVKLLQERGHPWKADMAWLRYRNVEVSEIVQLVNANPDYIVAQPFNVDHVYGAWKDLMAYVVRRAPRELDSDENGDQ